MKPLDEKLLNSMVAVHHVTNSSTKTPLLFTGHFQTPLSIGPFKDAAQLLKDLRVLINMPNETLLFPKMAFFDKNMPFMAKLEPNNKDFLNSLKNLGEQAGVLGVGIDLQIELAANAWLRLESIKELVLADDVPEAGKEYELVAKKLRKVEEMIKKEGYWGEDWSCLE